MAQKITLQTWAEREYAQAPHRNTLYRWAKNGWIFPIPTKHGKTYFCEPHARFVGPDPDPEDIARAYEPTTTQ
jgi:hypothetical protein